MTLANAAAQTPSIDPTMLAFLTIFGAAAVTALAGFGLAVWQSRRDHQRWVRERRYDGFTRILALAERYSRRRSEGEEMKVRAEALQASATTGDPSVAQELHDLADDMARIVEQVGAITEELGDVATALEILGPNHVLEALNAFTDTFPGDDDDATEQAKDAFVIAVRRALNIRA